MSEGKCVNCDEYGPIEKHHLISMRKFHFGFGRGRKVPDWMVMRVCPSCHVVLHQNKMEKMERSELEMFLILKTMYEEKNEYSKSF